MNLTIITSSPQRFEGWLAELRRELAAVAVVPPEPHAATRALIGGAVAVVLLDATDPQHDAQQWLHWLGQAVAAPPAVIVVVSREHLRGWETADADDLIDLSAPAGEVLWRIRRLGTRLPSPPPLRLGGLTLFPTDARAMVEGRATHLRQRELELLRFLVANPNRVFRREELVRAVWGMEYDGSPRTVDVHVRRIRERLGDFGREHLQTVRGVGYRMAAPRGHERNRTRVL